MACKKFSTSLSLIAVSCASNNRDLPGRPSSSVASTATRCWRALPFVRCAMACKPFPQSPAPGGICCRCAALDCRSIDKNRRRKNKVFAHCMPRLALVSDLGLVRPVWLRCRRVRVLTGASSLIERSVMIPRACAAMHEHLFRFLVLKRGVFEAVHFGLWSSGFPDYVSVRKALRACIRMLAGQYGNLQRSPSLPVQCRHCYLTS